VDSPSAPGRKYRRRLPGEPVNPEWTAPQLPDGSFASPPPSGVKPLTGVLGEVWEEYRRHAARLLPLAAAGVVAAGLATALVQLMAGQFDRPVMLLLVVPATWLLSKLVMILLVVVTVGLVYQTRAQDEAWRPAPARLRECVGEVTAVWLIATLAVLAGLLLFVIPGLYLIAVWEVCVPVIVIERTGPLAALRRSRELIRGHGWHVLGLIVALTVLQNVVSLVLRAAFSWLPLTWQLTVANGIAVTAVIPAGALLATLIYYRLTAAEAAEAAARAATGLTD
jgi:hypothetical protein